MKKVRGIAGTYFIYTTTQGLMPFILPFEKAKHLPANDYPCVYALFNNKAEVVYIGHSEHQSIRIRSHFKSTRFDFTSFVVLGCNWMDMLLIEGQMIQYFMPVNNILTNPLYEVEMAKERARKAKAAHARRKAEQRSISL